MLTIGLLCFFLLMLPYCIIKPASKEKCEPIVFYQPVTEIIGPYSTEYYYAPRVYVDSAEAIKEFKGKKQNQIKFNRMIITQKVYRVTLSDD
jgi:hypothetical protein